jgi:transcriptional regulator with XRE-family HTH domain
LEQARALAEKEFNAIPAVKGKHQNLRRERMRRKITRKKLAEQVGLNIRTVQKIEAGNVNILLATVLRLRKAPGCSWDALLGKQ